MTERGQTQQDYLIGIIILILTLISVFALIPGIFEPFQNPVQAQEQDEADRLADTLLTNASVDGGTLVYRSNTSGKWGLDNATEGAAFETLLAKAGISSARSGTLVNVTVQHGQNELFWSEGPATSSYRVNEGAAATTVRIIRFADDDSCDPACRLVVRVWSG